jgi:cytosine/adenosine deaminase-related metal-dependent hydrolase
LLTTTLFSPDSAIASTTPITFHGARVARSAYSAKYRNLSVHGSAIENVSMPAVAQPRRHASEGLAIDLSGCLVLPGLINAHDHLDFSVFPRLGCGPHPSWREWGADIHSNEASRIEECLRVPLEARLWWGGIRNLLCGVTTVSHHNPYLYRVFHSDFPAHVLHECGWAHSLAEVHRVDEKFHRTPPRWPFILHLAEGTDHASQCEFDALERLLPLDNRTVMVHCVGLTASQWDRAAQIAMGIIWCPTSNLYTLGKTLSSERVTSFPNIALGSDSPLSGTGDLLDEIRFAYDEIDLPSPFVYDLVTVRAARILRLGSGEGFLQRGSKADLIVTRDKQLAPADTLVRLSWRDIDLVMENGRIVLLSAGLAPRIPRELKEGMQPITVDGVDRLLRAPVRDLWHQTFSALGRTPTLSGRTVSLADEPPYPDSFSPVFLDAVG